MPLKHALLVLALLGPAMANAQTLPADTTREVGQLFNALEHSGCEFYRNGSWYDAQKASSHLHEKYDYLLGRGRITSTESFIDQGASRSSMSGQSYMVRCGQSQPIESRTWFTKVLHDLRAKAVAAGKAPRTTS